MDLSSSLWSDDSVRELWQVEKEGESSCPPITCAATSGASRALGAETDIELWRATMRELGTCLVIVVLTIAGFLAGSGQSLASTESQEAGPASVEIEPSSLALEVGDKVQIRAVVKDVGGKILPDAQVIFFSLNRVAVGVTPSGSVEAHRPGQYRVAALSPEKPFEGEADYYSTSDPGIRATIR